MRKAALGALSFMALAIPSAIASPCLAKGVFAAQEMSPDSSDIAESDVYWDIYSMCADKWMEDHPDSAGFNPYYITPKYGSSHTKSLIGSSLAVVPSGEDLYLYMWFDTSDYGWNGASGEVALSTSTAIADSGGYEVAERTVDAQLVSEYGFDSTGGSNWLGKYRLSGALEGGSGNKHVELLSFSFIYFDQDGEQQTVSIELSEDLQWNGDQVDDGGFEYALESDNYVNIRRKKVNMILEPDLNSDKEDWEYRSNSSMFADDGSSMADKNCLAEFNIDAKKATAYERMYETTYCFFEPVDYFSDGVRIEYPINQVTEISFSFNRMTYRYSASGFENDMLDFVDTMPCYTGLYGKPNYKSPLENGAYFSDESYEYVEKAVSINEGVSYVTRDERNFLFWNWPEERSKMDAIVDCSDTSGWEDDPDYATLLQFIEDNKWDYRWAFLVDQSERNGYEIGSEKIKYNGWWWRHWNAYTECHEVTDLAILRLKFSNVANESFDLTALDTTDNTESVYVPSTGGSVVGVNGHIVSPMSPDLNAWENFLDVLRIIGVCLGAALLIYGLWKVYKLVATVKSAKR